MKLSYSKFLIAIGLMIVFLAVPQTVAANVELKFIEPEKFRDIELIGHNKKRSIDLVSKNLTVLFSRLANKYVSENEKLLIEVTDIDLAGRIEYMVGPNHEKMRILRDNDSFKLYFKFKSINKKGDLIRQGESKLSNFFSRSPGMRKKSNTNTVAYFEKELKKWFKQEFAPKTN